jgi:uncharacterized protein (TIGR02246 family)
MKRSQYAARILCAALIVPMALALPASRVAAGTGEARGLAQAFASAWNEHDARSLGSLMAPDVEFVTVGAIWLHGRGDVEKFHARLFAGRLAESTNTVLETSVRSLRADLALLHWSWTVVGEKDAKGQTRPQRWGLMTVLAEKQNGTWLIVASTNTNAGIAVEESRDLQSPIAVPRLDAK